MSPKIWPSRDCPAPSTRLFFKANFEETAHPNFFLKKKDKCQSRDCPAPSTGLFFKASFEETAHPKKKLKNLTSAKVGIAERPVARCSPLLISRRRLIIQIFFEFFSQVSKSGLPSPSYSGVFRSYFREDGSSKFFFSKIWLSVQVGIAEKNPLTGFLNRVSRRRRRPTIPSGGFFSAIPTWTLVFFFSKKEQSRDCRAAPGARFFRPSFAKTAHPNLDFVIFFTRY